MSTRINRTRLLAAATIAVATLTLTACNDGQGTNDEGAATGSTTTSSPKASGTNSSGSSGGTSTGSTGKNSTGGSTGSSGTTGSTGTSGSKGSKGSNDSDSAPVTTSCSPATTRTTATPVTRPLNHLLLTVTNTGSKNCNLVYYPAVKFQDAQSVPPAIEDSKPQAVVTLAPGESGYASVLLAAADGSGSNGYTAKSLEVYFDKSANAAAHPSLPAKGVYIDSSIKVSYWQSDMGDALQW